MFSLCVNGQPGFVALKAIDLQTEQVLGDVTAQLKSIAVCANILLFGFATVMDRGVLSGVQMTLAYKLSYFHRSILSTLVPPGRVILLLVVWLQPLLTAPVVVDLDMLLPSVVLIDDDARAVWLHDRALVIHGNSLSTLVTSGAGI